MIGYDILIDTNIAIYAMEAHPAVKGLIACVPVISIISEIELFGKKDISAQEVENIKTLLAGFPVIPISNTIKEIAIDLKQKYSIKTPDAIIAATAQSLGLTFITADKGFAKIKGIDAIIIELQKFE
ncbi:MAG: type II toxin-antitoxin system VapC family toxin [Bacteroidetes bacterium]|nr:type II toxin-antitoxin system VapC family toxin [Bacteroidota bacterium]